MEIGKIDWAFGYNFRADCANNFGYIISLKTNQSLYFNRNSVVPNSRLLKANGHLSGDYVIYEPVEDKQSKSGFIATHVQALDEYQEDNLLEKLSDDIKTDPKITQLLLDQCPQCILRNNVRDYFPLLDNKKIKDLFIDRIRSDYFKVSIAKEVKKYLKLKSTVAWRTSYWDIFDFSQEQKMLIAELCYTAIQKGFGIFPLCQKYPQLWIEEPDFFTSLSNSEQLQLISNCRQYIQKNNFDSLFQKAHSNEVKKLLCNTVPMEWLLENNEYYPYFEQSVIEYLDTIEWENNSETYLNKCRHIVSLISNTTMPEASRHLSSFLLAMDIGETSPWWNSIDQSIKNTISSVRKKQAADERINSLSDDSVLISTEPQDSLFEDDPSFQTYCEKYCINTSFSGEQRKAIQVSSKACLLFAVPGSGKTTVLVNRIAYLVYGCNINGSSILSITFGKDAAGHMKEKYIELTHNMRSPKDSIPAFSTIHALCYKIISRIAKEKNEYKMPRLVADQHDTPQQDRPSARIKRIVESLAKENNIEEKNLSIEEKDNRIEQIGNAIGYIINKDLNDDDIKKIKISVDSDEIAIEPIYRKYIVEMENDNCIDYDLLLRTANKWLSDENNRDILERYRNFYRYLFVDEAQDVTTIQFSLIKLLVGNTGTVFMVGDDDQSIFGFRGADPQEMLDFKKMFPDGTILKMSTNFRSYSDIVNASHAFIKHNVKRENKAMASHHSEQGVIRHVHFSNVETEIEYILNEANQFHLHDQQSKEKLAILYRTNVSALPILAGLIDRKIPFTMDDRFMKKILDTFKNNKICKDILALLKFSTDMTSFTLYKASYWVLGLYLNYEHLQQVHNLHEAGENVLNSTIEYILNSDIRNNVEVAQQVLDRRNKLINFVNLSPYDAICTILNDFDYSTINITTTSQWMSVYGLLTISRFRGTIHEFLVLIDKFLNQGAFNARDDRIILSTMHSSKGQEYSKVLIIDAIEDIIPGKRKNDDYSYDPEEERRLFYVAITRAEKCLEILSPDTYHGHFYTISTFVNQFKAGMQSCLEETYNNIKETNAVLPTRMYYVVRNGENPGIHSDKKSQHIAEKEFESFIEAEAYLQRSCLELKTQFIKNFLSESQDLPSVISEIILDTFDTDNLDTLSATRRKEIKRKAFDLFLQTGVTDYSSCTDIYELVYMPVNFYKSWYPLSELLRDRKIPVVSSRFKPIKILELGAGPGTTTLSMLEFYRNIAKENPSQEIYIDYHIVEYESAFKELLIKNLTKYKASTIGLDGNIILPNIHFKVSFYNDNAFTFLQKSKSNQYDIIIESNMLNQNEHVNAEDIDSFVENLEKNLVDYGRAILIEPADESIDYLTDIVYCAEHNKMLQVLQSYSLTKTDISQIHLYKKAIEIGIRRKEKQEHYFAYTIFQKTL